MRFFRRTRHADRDLAQSIHTAETRLAELNLPATNDLGELLDNIGWRRNRRIHLIPLAMRSSAPSGLWFALEDSDLIVHESETTRTHKDHIIAHELSHMICGHESNPDGDEHFLSLLFPDLEPTLVQTMLSRSTYSDRHEAEAEIMASLILRRIRAQAGEPRSDTPPDQADIASRLDDSFLAARTAAG